MIEVRDRFAHREEPLLQIERAPEQDRDDVRGVIAVQGDRIDWEYVHKWCEQHGTRALLDENPSPTDQEIRTAISGAICRCTGYVNIVEAIKAAAQ